MSAQFLKKIGKNYSISIRIILDFFERTGYDLRDQEIGKDGSIRIVVGQQSMGEK